MNAKTQYELENVTFGFQGGKWRFEVAGTFTLIQKCPGGYPTAEAVARKIVGSAKRAKSPDRPIDGLCRYEISRLVNPQVQED